MRQLFTRLLARRAVSRPKAQARVDRRTDLVDGFKAVSLKDARRLLGQKRYEAMMRDAVRNKGPRPGWVYPWNVVDYLATSLGANRP